ncbi:hypothetical protein ACFX14_045775 [Malus domestica]
MPRSTASRCFHLTGSAGFAFSPVTPQAEEPNLGGLVWSTQVDVGGTDNRFKQSKRGIVTVGKLGISCSSTRFPEFLFFLGTLAFMPGLTRV